MYDLSIGEHAAIWRGIVVNGKLNSNYGHYIFNKEGYNWVVNELMRDKDSRRAYIMILGNPHLNVEEKDVPCTLSLGFRIRKGKLNMSVRMRSQDAIFGMGNDAPAFSFIHQMLLSELWRFYPELELGNYHHVADSFHIYKRHFSMLDQITAHDAEFTDVTTPEISSWAETDWLVKHRKSLTFPTLNPFSFVGYDPGFQFSRWLTGVDIPYDPK